MASSMSETRIMRCMGAPPENAFRSHYTPARQMASSAISRHSRASCATLRASSGFIRRTSCLQAQAQEPCEDCARLPTTPCSKVDDFPEDRLIGVNHARLDKTCFAHPTQNLLARVALHALARMEPAGKRIVAARSFLLKIQQVQRPARLENAPHLAHGRALRVLRYVVKHQA